MNYAKGGTFTFAIGDDLGDFDPYHSQLLFAYAQLAYDSLVHLKPDGSFVTGLAEKWTADAHGAEFTLRHGVTCSDGTPLTASQVAADLTYLGNPKNASPMYGVFTPKTPYTVTGDDAAGTVKVALKQPFGFIMNTLGLAPIVCAKGLQNPAILKTGSAGTGPFVLTGVVRGQSLTFTARKNYTWGPGGARTDVPGFPAKLVLRVVSNETTAANLLLSGEVNLAMIAGQDHRRLEARGLASLKKSNAGAWLWFNHSGKRPTGDKQVRQALVQALDFPSIIKVNTDGAGTPSSGLIAQRPRPCNGDTVTGQLPQRDVSAANTVLDRAGWVRGPDGIRSKGGAPLRVDIHYVPSLSPFDRPTVELIANQWNAIGVQVKQSPDTSTGMSKVMFETSGFDVYMQGFGSNLPSQMVPYLSGPVPPKGVNLAGIDNKDYDRLVAKASTLTPPTACPFWDQAEQALFRDLDVVPIADRAYSYFLNKAQARIVGFEDPIASSLRVLG